MVKKNNIRKEHKPITDNKVIKEAKKTASKIVKNKTDKERKDSSSQTKPKHPGGRPSKFSQKLADKLLTKISTSNQSLRTICSDKGMPSVTTVLKWLRTSKEFASQYAYAKEEQADLLVEEMLAIADDGTNDTMTVFTPGGETKDVEDKEWVNRSRLRVDTRKFIASKLKPKKYGDKLDLTSDGKELLFRTWNLEVVNPKEED